MVWMLSRKIGGRAGLWMTSIIALATGTVAAAQKGDPPPAPPLVSVTARDAEVKAVITDLFQQAKISDYTISNDVAGRITISLKDKPFEDALTLIARVNVPPLSWNKTDGFYQIKIRRVSPRSAGEVPVAAMEPPPPVPDAGNVEWVPLMFTDPRGIVQAIEALRPPGLIAAFAYMPTNGLLVRFGRTGDPLVTGTIGGGPGAAGGGAGNTGGSGAGAGSTPPAGGGPGDPGGPARP